MRFLSLTLLLIACRSDSEPEVAEKEYILDADGDGFNRDEDCNDSDASIFPSSDELCDGIDNDCDNEIDEGVTSTYYIDADGDGFGSADITTEACELPQGFVGNGSDCNDANADAYPSAEEICDDIDNDCNGVVDEGQGDFYHVDADGDGVRRLHSNAPSCSSASLLTLPLECSSLALADSNPILAAQH